MSLGVPAFAVPPRSAWEIWHRKLLVATLAPLLDGYLGESSEDLSGNLCIFALKDQLGEHD